jgi:NitT/TauT family transport system substrate-binding protein
MKAPVPRWRPARMRLFQISVVLGVLWLWVGAALAQASGTTTLRVGHFSNVTHLQGLIGHSLTRQGKGWFEQRLGPNVKIEWLVYNAGPGAMEALFANSIDLTYVGPNPAINAYVKSAGEEVRIIAGAANGGAALVVQPDLPLKSAADFKGHTIATPQFGNTQDVAARAWLIAGGLKITQTGGDAQVIPTANPDQLLLFKSRQIDAVWTVEPWVTRLENEAGGKVLVNDDKSITTVLVSSVGALKAHRDLVAKFVAANAELTEWIKAHPQDSQRLVRDEIEAETRTPMSAELVRKAWSRIVVTSDVAREPLESFLKSAQAVGFLRGTADLSRLVEKP